jgi:hypothetical protein
MPYDPAKTKQLLFIAQAHAQSPLGEFTAEMAGQLREAEAEILTANSRAGAAEREKTRLEEERDALLGSLQKARSGNTGHSEMVAALTAIAKNPKGSQQKAKTALTAAGITVQ